MAGAGWYHRRHRHRPVQILRNDLGLTGTKFGCGLPQCGAGTALVDGRAAANLREGAEMDAAHLSRRGVLAAGGVMIVGLGLDGVGRAPAQTVPRADRFLGEAMAPDAVDSFLAVHADGSVTIFVGKVDIGTSAVRSINKEGPHHEVDRCRSGASRGQAADCWHSHFNRVSP